MSAIHQLIKQLDAVYNGSPWYGSSIKESLTSVKENQYAQRVNTHNIAEYVWHMLTWKLFVIKRLEGDLNFTIELNTDADWKKIDKLSSFEWQQLLVDMDVTHQKLITILHTKNDFLLSEQVASAQYIYTYEIMLNGILQHDVYHLGQLNLVKSILNAKEK